LDAIVILQGGLLLDFLVVDPGAVAAVEVLDVKDVLHAGDLGVLAADGIVRDQDLALHRIPAHDEFVAVEINPLAGGSPLQHRERRHVIVLRQSATRGNSTRMLRKNMVRFYRVGGVVCKDNVRVRGPRNRAVPGLSAKSWRRMSKYSKD